MKKCAAVIGHPIGHSLSPSIFSYLSELNGIPLDFEYKAVDLKPEDLSAWYEAIRSQAGWIGFNVTSPHKEAIARIVHSVSNEASMVGAVNVVGIAKSGQTCGYNTDVFGVAQTLRQYRVSIHGERVLMIGAGGAARAACVALALEGAREIVVWNLTRQSGLNKGSHRAEKMIEDVAKSFPLLKLTLLSIPDLEEASEQDIAALAQTKLFVQATPLGMQGHPTAQDAESQKPFESLFNRIREHDQLTGSKAIEGGRFAFEMIYKPEETGFLKLAALAGFRPIGGLSMLVYQALATWRIWFTGHAKEDEVRLAASRAEVEVAEKLMELLRSRFKSEIQKATETLTDKQVLFLTGFMGAGKTTIGRLLAKRAGCRFEDLDERIERISGKSVAELFSKSGESFFREQEWRELVALCQEISSLPKTGDFKPSVVVALGGGTLTNLKALEEVRRFGTLIYLQAKLTTLLNRLGPDVDRRPLLSGLSTVQQTDRIEALLATREKTYLQADQTIETDALDSEQIADAAWALWLESKSVKAAHLSSRSTK